MDLNAQALVEIAAVKGQLTGISEMIQANHEASNRRLDDFRKSVEGTVGNIEKRLGKLEQNERGTAIRSAGTGALAGAIVAGAIALIKTGSFTGIGH